MLNRKILVLLITIIIIGVFFYFLSKDDKSSNKEISTITDTLPNTQDSSPVVISTNPPDLQNTIIIPNQTIQITFSDSVLNIDELKHKMDPEGDYKLKLSDDRKTLSIIPSPTFKLGTGYTFFIFSNDTKFDNGKKLESDIIYHFQTIVYHGV